MLHHFYILFTAALLRPVYGRGHMDFRFSKAPDMYGMFHISMLVAFLVADVLLFLLLKKKHEKTLRIAIHVMGIVMVVMEIWKQWFIFTYIYERYTMWFFPWQLCSMAMYLSVLLPFLKGKAEEASLVFLSTFSLFAAVMALLVPSDMLREQVLFTLHGFIYHEIMIAESLCAMMIVARRREYRFRPSVELFIILAFIAEVINVIGHYAIGNINREPDMFFITPFYKTDQPVFGYIADKLGIIPEIIIYLSLIVLAAFLIFIAIRRYIGSKDSRYTPLWAL